MKRYDGARRRSSRRSAPAVRRSCRRRRPAGPPPQAQDGGLSVMPALIEHRRAAGRAGHADGGQPLGGADGRHRDAAPVGCRPRPARCPRTGAATLPGVSVSQSTFTLAPGAEKQVTATLDSAPSAGYLYGALEVVGLPTDVATRKGVVLGYRARRRDPDPARRRRSTAITRRQRSRRPRAPRCIPVKNTGNTLDAGHRHGQGQGRARAPRTSRSRP